jgi:hypothetical protein
LGLLSSIKEDVKKKHISPRGQDQFADIIAVAGNPLADVNEMERVRFVMKGGMHPQRHRRTLEPPARVWFPGRYRRAEGTADPTSRRSSVRP